MNRRELEEFMDVTEKALRRRILRSRWTELDEYVRCYDSEGRRVPFAEAALSKTAFKWSDK
jgi:hypothetical protein